MENPSKRYKYSKNFKKKNIAKFELSDFERQIQDNIKEKMNFLKDLGVTHVIAGLDGLVNCKKKSQIERRGLKPHKRKSGLPPAEPRRLSLRIAGKDPLGVQLPEKPKSVSYQQPLDVYPRPEPGPLTLLSIEKNQKSGEDAEKFIRELSRIPVHLTNCEPITFDRVASYFDKMKLAEKSVAKVVPHRIFSVAVHPSETKTLICAGGKWGGVGLWDLDSKTGEDGVHFYAPHSRPVNGLAFDKHSQNLLYSVSYDGTVRCLDLNKGVFNEVYVTDVEDQLYCKAMDFLSSNTIAVAQDDGTFAVVDTRSNNHKAENIYYAHGRYLKCISAHPNNEHHVMTSSVDGNARVWDLRQAKKKPDCLAEMPHPKSVSSAYFSPVTGNRILTTSLDNKLRIYDSSDLTECALLHTISHNNYTGRWLTPFRAVWHPKLDDLFVVGSMDHPRRIEIFNGTGHLVKTFEDEEYLKSVCSINAFHPTQNILVGGNSSGRVHVFM